MKKDNRAAAASNKGGLESFVNEYLTTRNVLMGLGVASLAGVATYSTMQAVKNGKVLNRIKKEVNLDAIRNAITSKVGDVGAKVESLGLLERLGIKGKKKEAGSNNRSSRGSVKNSGNRKGQRSRTTQKRSQNA